MTPTPPLPWYRHRWPWFLMLAPGTALVVGFYSLWLSIETADALVAEDYYKAGSAINQDLHRDQIARQLGLSGQLSQYGEKVSVTLQARAAFAAPPAVQLRLIHATRAGLDRVLVLEHQPAGNYQGTLSPLAPGRWNVLLLDPEGSWRLAGSWQGPSQKALRLGALGQ